MNFEVLTDSALEGDSPQLPSLLLPEVPFQRTREPYRAPSGYKSTFQNPRTILLYARHSLSTRSTEKNQCFLECSWQADTAGSLEKEVLGQV